MGNEGNGNYVVILDKLQQLPGAEIGWNEIVSDPHLSSVGDFGAAIDAGHDIEVFNNRASQHSPYR